MCSKHLPHTSKLHIRQLHISCVAKTWVQELHQQPAKGVPKLCSPGHSSRPSRVDMKACAFIRQLVEIDTVEVLSDDATSTTLLLRAPTQAGQTMVEEEHSPRWTLCCRLQPRWAS